MHLIQSPRSLPFQPLSPLLLLLFLLVFHLIRVLCYLVPPIIFLSCARFYRLLLKEKFNEIIPGPTPLLFSRLPALPHKGWILSSTPSFECVLFLVLCLESLCLNLDMSVYILLSKTVSGKTSNFRNIMHNRPVTKILRSSNFQDRMSTTSEIYPWQGISRFCSCHLWGRRLFSPQFCIWTSASLPFVFPQA